MTDIDSGAVSGPASEMPPRGRRILHILGAVLVGVVLPAVVVGVLVGEIGVSALFTGVLWGALGAKLGGTRRMVYLSPGIGLVAGLAAYTAYDWWWVALLATVGLVSGIGFRFGSFGACLMAPFAATFVTPVSDGTAAIAFGVIVAIGTGYGIVIARRFGATRGRGRPILVAGHRRHRDRFGAVLGAAASVGVALSWTEPYWVPEPILILVMYLLMGRRERIQEKALGTAAGAATAVVVAIIAPPTWVLTALAILAFLLAVMQRATYWLMYGLYTFALVIYLAAPDDVGFEAEERGVQILAGIAILVVLPFFTPSVTA